MTVSNSTSVVITQQQILDAAKAQLAAVRSAVELTNQVVFDATDEYLNILAKDAEVFTKDAAALEDISTRGNERATALTGLQDKVVQGVAKAWQPVTDRLVNDVAALSKPQDAAPGVTAPVVTAPVVTAPAADTTTVTPVAPVTPRKQA